MAKEYAKHFYKSLVWKKCRASYIAKTLDGTVSFRVATKCELCGRGTRLYDLNMVQVTRKICADDYYKLVGLYPQEAETETPTTIEQQ